VVTPTFRPGQVAELLGVSVDTVRRWADAGRLRTRRTKGGQRLIDGADLARYLREAPAADQAESVVEHDVKVTLLAERWDPRDAGLGWCR